MNGPEENGGFLARLRANETLQRITGGRPEIALIGIPTLIVLVVVGVLIGVAAAGGGGGGDDEQATGRTPTASRSGTPEPESTGTGVSGGHLTPIAVSPGDQLTAQDLAARGAGEAPRGDFLGDRLIIPSIGVDAPFSVKVVPTGGQMPNPNGPNDVAWYDFSQWPGLGGVPGKGGNVVLAGHVDYINVGPAVFWDVNKLKIGDRIQMRMKDGTVIEYAVEFNKHIGANEADWTAIVAGTTNESITLITCTGEFSAGHYSDRQIIWGRRVV